MNNTKHGRTIALLERGFLADSSQLLELGKAIAGNVDRTHDLAAGIASPDGRGQLQTSQREQIDGTVIHINSQVGKLEDSLQSNDPAMLTRALSDWEAVQADVEQLKVMLDALRQPEDSLNESGRRLWNNLEEALDTHRQSSDACVRAIQIKLDLLKDPAADEMEHLFQETLSNLPRSLQEEGLEAETYEQEYEIAAAELQHERENPPEGLLDTVKPLFMWKETVEERTVKNLTARRRAG